jgi:hypothetical protein
MNGPSVSDINDMKNILAALNGDSPMPKSPQVNNVHKQINGPINVAKLREPDVSGMKDILSKLSVVTDNTVVSLNESAQYDIDVREALETERTETGTRIGSWEIHTNVYEKMGKEIKTFDVFNVHTKETIAEDLYLYEVAHGLVRLFNRGDKLNSQNVRQLLTLEEQYTRNRIDALRFKKRYQDSIKSNDRTTAGIMESRYQKSRQEALSAKNRISELYESI